LLEVSVSAFNRVVVKLQAKPFARDRHAVHELRYPIEISVEGALNRTPLIADKGR
jgi:hypothetical protein